MFFLQKKLITTNITNIFVVLSDFNGLKKGITNIFVNIRDIRGFRKSTFIRDIRDIRAHEYVGNPGNGLQ